MALSCAAEQTLVSGVTIMTDTAEWAVGYDGDLALAAERKLAATRAEFSLK